MDRLFLFRREITPIRKLLMMKAVAGGIPLIEYTATGNPLTFETNVAKPLTQTLVTMTPKQAGTGDPSPTNVRAISGASSVNVCQTGSNLYNSTLEQGGLNSSTGAEVSNDKRIRSGYVYLKAGKYTVSVSSERTIMTIIYIYGTDPSKTFKSSELVNSFQYVPHTFTLSGDRYIRLLLKDAPGSNISPSDVQNVQIELGETSSPYAPYSGTTYPVTFPALGKNLYDAASYPLTSGWYVNGTTGSGASGANFQGTQGFIPVDSLQGKTVTLNKRPGGNSPGVAFYSSDSTSGFISGEKNNNATAGTSWTFTVPENAKYMRFSVPSDAADIQIELGSSATSYEPYTNTVYGGSLDLVTGVLTVTWAAYKVSNDTVFNTSTANPLTFLRINLDNTVAPPVLPRTDNNNRGECSDKMPWVVARTENKFGAVIGFYDSGTFYNSIYILNTNLADPSVQTAQDCIDYIKSIAPTFVYPIANPITYQLTPTEITALVGSNTMWADADNMTVKYWKKG